MVLNNRKKMHTNAQPCLKQLLSVANKLVHEPSVRSNEFSELKLPDWELIKNIDLIKRCASVCMRGLVVGFLF